MRRVVPVMAIVGLIPVLVGFTWPGTVEWLCTRGIKQYNAGEFTEAGESFERALEHRPLSEKLQFNRGAALHRQERHDAAAEAFELASESGDHQIARDAAYNLGNTHFTAGDLEAAIEAYKNALRLDPNDGEAKHNLELALNRQQEQQQQKQQKEQTEDDEQQSEDQQQQEQQQQEQQQEQAGDGQQEQAGDRSDEQQPSPAQQAEGELNEEQARRLLHALASQDAEMQKLIRRAPQRRQPSEGEKDW